MRSCLGGFVATCAVVAAVGGLSLAMLLGPSGGLPEGCTLDGIPLGGLSSDTARTVLAEHHERLSRFRVLVTTDGEGAAPITSAPLAPMLRPIDEVAKELDRMEAIPLPERLRALVGPRPDEWALTVFVPEASLPWIPATASIAPAAGPAGAPPPSGDEGLILPPTRERILRAVAESRSATAAVVVLGPAEAEGAAGDERASSDRTVNTR